MHWHRPLREILSGCDRQGRRRSHLAKPQRGLYARESTRVFEAQGKNWVGGRGIVPLCNSFSNRNLGTPRPSLLPQWEMASGSASCKYITPLPLPPSLSILTHAHLQAKWDHLHCRSRNNRICQAMESYHRGCRNLQA